MAEKPPQAQMKQLETVEPAESAADRLPDVTDREQLEAWLRQQPPEVSVAIAARAVLRELPGLATEFEQRNHVPEEIRAALFLPVFRAMALPWVAGTWPTRTAEVASAAAAAANFAFDAADLAARAAITADAAYVADAAARAARAGAYIDVAYAADAAVRAARATANADSAIQADVQAAHRGAGKFDLGGAPLWPDAMPESRGALWARLKVTLLSLDEGWEVWTDWYEARLEGRRASEELEVARATIPDAIWQQGPKVVNAHIRELIERYRETPPTEEAPAGEEHGQTVDQEPEPDTAADEGEPAGAGEIVFIGDAPVRDEDFLGRAELAFILAARLNRVWDEMNRRAAGESAYDAGFVVHIDAPWGGGKTSFANYLARILNPYAAPGALPDWLKRLPLADENYWPQAFRRPWHIVSFNAWQHQHVDPPWWCFYQAIRKQTCHAVRTEDWDLTDQRLPPAGAGWPGVWEIRHARWLGHWARELAWRLFTPKNLVLVAIAIPTLAIAKYGYDNGWFSAEGKPVEFVAAVAAVLTGGLSFVWAVFSTLTASLVPGTPDAAKNYSLGGGDPLERFRRHFARMMARLRRPVLVIVDDIDRCEPGFVVELIRGMQTILKSPRVVFLLLGDRDWIEHSFAETHKTMKAVPVGPEHSFGGRFVEKAIQLSLMLPDVLAEERPAYIRALLGTERAAADPVTALTRALSDDQRQEVTRSLSALEAEENPVARDEGAKQLREQVYGFSAAPELKEAVAKAIDRKVALRSAADEKVRAATQHRLEPIARVLPPNPRQMKRIINAISLFQEVARIRAEVQPETQRWRQLALWIVLMTEWPQTWATLAIWPDLVTRVHDADDATPIAGLDERTAQAWSCAVRESRDVMRLLDYPQSGAAADKGGPGGWGDAKIDAEAVRRLTAIMPPTSGATLPLPKPEDQKAGDGEAP